MAISACYGDFGINVLKALGITDTEVSRVLIDIDINGDDAVKVYVTRFMTTDKEEAFCQALKAAACKVVNVDSYTVGDFGNPVIQERKA